MIDDSHTPDSLTVRDRLRECCDEYMDVDELLQSDDWTKYVVLGIDALGRLVRLNHRKASVEYVALSDGFVERDTELSDDDVAHVEYWMVRTTERGDWMWVHPRFRWVFAASQPEPVAIHRGDN